jgi:CRP-like cAMP-binding protein/membrane protease YdiL (CAAX protease family)
VLDPVEDVVSFLRSQPTLAGMTDDELAAVLQRMEEVTYADGEVIISEGDLLDDIFFLRAGEVTIHKWDEARENHHVIGRLGPGETFGDMSFLDGSPRSSTIVATGPVRALVIRTAFAELGEYRAKIARNIALANIERLRRTNEEYVSSLQAELEQASLTNRFGKFFIAILAVMAVNNGVNRLVAASGVDVKATWFNWASLILLVLPILVFIAGFKYPLSTFGVTRRNMARSALLGVAVSAGMVIAFVGYRLVLHFASHGWQGGLPCADMSNPRVFGPLVLFYAPHSVLQEFASRGVVQTALQTFLRDKRGHLAIGVTSMVFAMLHMHHGVVAIVVTFVASVAFGYVYRPHGNLAGVSIVHFVGGTIAEYAGWV